MILPVKTRQFITGATSLMILLPGAYMRSEDFVTAGFFTAVSSHTSDLDLIALDLDLQGMANGGSTSLLAEEIIMPAREQGYRKIWLGGISLGGLLALALQANQPGLIDGLCLLAPYPGSRLTSQAIQQAGGVDAWQPSAEELCDPEFRIWQWLKRPPADFPVFVGYGREDRFAQGMAAIASRFPEPARYTVSGGHEWPVWQRLWEHFLASGFLLN